MAKVKLLGFMSVTGDLRVVTGLHIGGSATGIAIGATDNPVVRVNGKPYIPGSSLKGKIRSLLELAHGMDINDKLGRHECEGGEPCDICVVFGRGAERKEEEGPTRAIFRDCYINDEKSDPEARKSGYVEIKWENAIDRLTSRVEYGLRDSERVLPGTVFDVEIMFRVFDLDLDGGSLAGEVRLESLPGRLKARFGLLLEGMKLLESDSLGGCGSRGYGKVRFESVSVRYIPMETLEGVEVFSGPLEEALKRCTG